ncbi:Disintegrin And Metalloproteinase Domain-Containing Protein 21, partial [Manis pentadactyla]
HAPEGPGDILVPQAVDEGVERGPEDGVEGREHFIPLRGVVGLWQNVLDDTSPIEQRHQDHGCEEEHLNATPKQGDAMVLRESPGHFGDKCRDVQEVHEGELAEQEIHGTVELRVSPNEGDHCGVAQEGHQEIQHSEGKEGPGS